MSTQFRLFNLPFDIRTRIYDFMIMDLLGGFQIKPYNAPSLAGSLPAPNGLEQNKKAKKPKSKSKHGQSIDLSCIHELSVELLTHFYRYIEVQDGVPDLPIGWIHDGCDCCFDPIYEMYKKHGYRPYGRMIDRFHNFQIDLEKDLFQQETENGHYLENCGVVDGSEMSDQDPSDGNSFTGCMFALIVPHFARQPPNKQIGFRANVAPLIAGNSVLDLDEEDEFRRAANGLAALRALPNVDLQMYWGGPSSGHQPIRWAGDGPEDIAGFRKGYELLCRELERVGLSWSDIRGAPDVELYDREGAWPAWAVELALRFGNQPSEGQPFAGLFAGKKSQESDSAPGES